MFSGSLKLNNMKFYTML